MKGGMKHGGKMGSKKGNTGKSISPGMRSSKGNKRTTQVADRYR